MGILCRAIRLLSPPPLDASASRRRRRSRKSRSSPRAFSEMNAEWKATKKKAGKRSRHPMMKKRYPALNEWLLVLERRGDAPDPDVDPGAADRGRDDVVAQPGTKSRGPHCPEASSSGSPRSGRHRPAIDPSAPPRQTSGSDGSGSPGVHRESFDGLGSLRRRSPAVVHRAKPWVTGRSPAGHRPAGLPASGCPRPIPRAGGGMPEHRGRSNAASQGRL